MTVRRLLLGLGVCSLAAFVAACGSSPSAGSVVAAPSPSASPSPGGTTYVALGDDGTVAIGTTVCGTTLPSAACPSSATVTGTPLTVNGAPVNGYAQIFGQHVSVLHAAQPFFPVILGVSGALSGSAPVPGPSPNDIADNGDQLPSIPGIASSAAGRGDRLTLAFFAPVNDVIDAYYAQQCGSGTLTGAGGTLAAPCGSHGTTLPASTSSPRTGSLYSGYRAIFAAFKGAAPYAAVVVNLPDVSKFPAFASVSAPNQLALNGDVQLANAALKAAADDSGVTYAYADVYAAGQIQPGFYSSNAFAADGFHYSETGYSRIEGLVEQAFTAKYPSF